MLQKVAMNKMAVSSFLSTEKLAKAREDGKVNERDEDRSGDQRKD